jgi:DNA-binding NarL/FixJ family response regulator
MKVLIVEDHPLIRACVCRDCRAIPGCSVVGEGASAAVAVALLEAQRPDLLVLGHRACRMMTASRWPRAARVLRPSPAILVLTSHLNEFTLAQCERHRVQGFLDKAHSTEVEIGAALRALQAGRTYFGAPYVAARRDWKADPRAITKLLSDHEVRILALIARGLDDREIAEKVRAKPTTVRTHRDHIRHKLGVHTTPQLMDFAVRRGFGGIH